MSFTANSTGGQYKTDLKHYHYAPSGFDGNNYFIGRLKDKSFDYVEYDTNLGYAFSGGSSQKSSVRHFGTSDALNEIDLMPPYSVPYIWKRIA